MKLMLSKLLVELGFKHSDLHVVTTRLLGRDIMTSFSENFPDRYTEVINNMYGLVAIAAGIASCGKKVLTCIPPSSFITVLKEIKELLEWSQLDVKILNVCSDLNKSWEETLTYCFGDIAMIRPIMGINILVPADPIELRACVDEVVSSKGPVYVRVGMDWERVYSECNCRLGVANVIRDGTDVTIIAVGSMVAEALKAANNLKSLGISAAVIDSHTIRPIDRDTIVKYARNTGAVITAEDHHLIGGLGSAVAEVLMREYPVPVIPIGVKEVNHVINLTTHEFRRKLGLTSAEIVEAAKRLLHIR